MSAPQPPGLRERFWTLLDAGHSLDPLQQARLRSLQLAAFTMVAGLIWSLVSFALGDWLSGAVLFSVGLVGVPVAVSARRLRLRLAGQLLTVAVLIGALSGVVSRGGVQFSATAWLLAVPVSAYSYLGLRWGGAWTVVTILTAALLWLIQDLGLVSYPQMEDPVRWQLVLLDYLTLPGLISFGMWTGYQGHRVAMARLDEQNAALHVEVQERQRAEAAALASVQSREAFLAVMSHEIRTPLNGVLGMTEVLLGQGLDPEQEETAQMVRSSGVVLRRLLDEVLDYSKIDAGRLELEAEPVDLRSLGRELVDGIRGRAQDKGLEVHLDIGPELPAWVRADGLRLRQVLGNLLSNALKFTERGDIRLRMGGESGALRLTVQDSGIGMSPQEAARVFEPFQQADVSTTRRFGGTGLGLSISKQLVEAMGGSVEVDSQVSRGSAFHLSLPLEACPPPAESLERVTTVEDLRGMRVLVAEDNVVNQIVIERLLERYGVCVRLVADGRAAVDAWRSWGPDLILMDLRMPKLDGHQATAEIRAAGGSLPIVALTANTLPSDRELSREAGMSDHLGKPIDLHALTGCLLRWRLRAAA